MKRSDIINFLESKDTYKNVVNILNKFHPNFLFKYQNAFVCGGSVSNTIYHLLYGHKLAVNDIDIYLSEKEHKNRKDSPLYQALNDELYTSDDVTVMMDNYHGGWHAYHNNMFRMVGHERDGIINVIFYEIIRSEKNVNVCEMILDSFDLNNCKSGLDGQEGKIIYTEEFVDFLLNKQMKVVNPSAPLQTAIRIVKKNEELEGVYCNVDHEIRYLQASFDKLATNYSQSRVIGLETKDKYEIYKDKISKYFTVRQFKDYVELKQHVPYEMYIKFEKGNIKIEDIPFWLYEVKDGFKITEGVYTLNEVKRIWYLFYTFKKKSEQDKINKIAFKNISDRLDKHIPNNFTYRMLLIIKDYYKCDFSLKHLEYVDNFVNEHYGIQVLLSKVNTIMDQYRIIKYIKKLAKKDGDWVIGVLETANITPYFGENKTVVTKDLIDKILEDQKNESLTESISKINIDGFKFANHVTEITNKVDMKVEGHRMGHCVGGYWSNVSSGLSRIFHIEYNGIGSTVEILTPLSSDNVFSVVQLEDQKKSVIIYKNGETNTINTSQLLFNVSQHYGRYPEKGNLKPTVENEKIVSKLVNFLNENYVLKIFNINTEYLADKEKSLTFVV